MPLRVICEMIGIPTVDVTRWRVWAARPVRRLRDGGARGPRRRRRGDDRVQRLRAGDDRRAPRRAARRPAQRAHRGRGQPATGCRRARAGGHGRAADLRRARDHPEPARQRRCTDCSSIPTSSPLLRREPDRVPDAVEEMLRYDPPILFTSRIAREDMELAGVPVAADQLVMLNLTAANHDPGPVRRPRAVRHDARPTCATSRSVTASHFCLGREPGPPRGRGGVPRPCCAATGPSRRSATSAGRRSPRCAAASAWTCVLQP